MKTARFYNGLIPALVGLSSLISLMAASSGAYAQGANQGYTEAQRAFQGRDYSNAAKYFYQVVIASQGDVKTKAEFGLAESLRKMGLNYSASYFYSRIVAQGPRNDFFRHSLESLGEINSKTPLGHASVSGLFNAKIDPLQVPGPARGFYFFYKGLDAFDSASGQGANIAKARAEFERVPSNSTYYARSQYYLGVISSVLKDSDTALGAFSRVARAADSETLRTLATLNIGRVYYERKDYRKAFTYYSQIPRDSDLWLQSLFEGSWAFFMIQKHNNSLGNIHTIHSPFFVNRFYPETYILNAITYLRLCRYPNVRDSLKKFQQRYKPTFADLNNLLKKYQNQNSGFYSLIARYRSSGSLREYQAATEVIDSVSRSDAFKEAQAVVRGLDREAAALKNYAGKWEMVGLSDTLRQSFDTRKNATISGAGENLFSNSVQLFRYLRDLSDQTRLINLEMLSGRTDELRSKFNPDGGPADNISWGEGMKPLNLKAELEYWPFEGEYWEDELGGYVYNVDSKCGGAAAKKDEAKKKDKD